MNDTTPVEVHKNTNTERREIRQTWSLKVADNTVESNEDCGGGGECRLGKGVREKRQHEKKRARTGRHT